MEFRGGPRHRPYHPGPYPGYRLQGYRRHASPDDPQYEIASDRTDHIAAHKGIVLQRI
ncbi:hypervirulence associated TUDOR domain-containing protein [Paracoccus yeei]|uniref:DUF2945 domain-containing protein n=1 Tax=Paracoccus yeei TaxID=147645 RepID=UPI001E4AA0E8|nr:DUF2945 domain-containing protein [Paracoccus yeei]